MSRLILVPVRCPYCRKLAAEATPGAQLRVKCARCHALFEWMVVTPAEEPTR